MRLILLMPLFAAASAASAAVSRQPPSAADPDSANQSVVVTGERDSRKAVGEFVRALTPTTGGNQLSRFERSVCPAVVGLAGPQADAVSDRIRQVAKAAGIAVSGDGCAPNLVLVATADKRVFLKELWRRRSDYFDSGIQARALQKQPGPAAAWQLKGPPVSARGTELYEDPALGVYVNRTTEGSSRLSAAARPQFEAAVVVVEKKALAGLTVTQLADYAAIRALTGADPSRLAESTAPTILHVLEVPIGGEAPVTMTDWDFAFLRGFYDARRSLSTARQRSEMTKEMTEELKEPK